MPEAERKARSRAARRTVQLNVEVPEQVREAVASLAKQTDRTQAEVLAAAVSEYVTRHLRDSHATVTPGQGDTG